MRARWGTRRFDFVRSHLTNAATWLTYSRYDSVLQPPRGFRATADGLPWGHEFKSVRPRIRRNCPGKILGVDIVLESTGSATAAAKAPWRRREEGIITAPRRP